VLDISRHWLLARCDDEGAHLVLDWAPGRREEAMRAELGKSAPVARILSSFIPDRLADALCLEAGVDPGISFERLSRESRSALVRTVSAYRLPVTGDRGFTHAEVTAGGIPLAQVDLKTMESRICPGLHLVGEILDVDGRIGGFNFQWAWASGFVAGDTPLLTKLL
jgi:predicted Rossmann fold flavoprotein